MLNTNGAEPSPVSRADDLRVDAATMNDLDAVTELWVDLARGQRRHGSTLLAAENREAARKWVARSIVTGELLVARPDDAARDAARDDDDQGDHEHADDDQGDHEHADDDQGDHGDRETERTAPGDPDILGFVGFSLEHGEYGRDHARGTVSNLYVRPDRRGEGIGATLLAAAEAALADAGADVVALEALVANERARGFYTEHGYEPNRVELKKALSGDGTGDDA